MAYANDWFYDGKSEHQDESFVYEHFPPYFSYHGRNWAIGTSLSIEVVTVLYKCKDGKEKLGLDQGYSLLQRFNRLSSSVSE